MGSGASCGDTASEKKLEVDGIETLVIEVGKDGEAVTRGTSLPIEKVQQIFVVIDPRAGRCQSDVSCLNDAKVLRKVMRGGGGKTLVKVFVLVPTTTSSKAHLMNAHIAVQFLCHWADQDPCYIRVDDYYHNGDAIMKAMVEADKSIYPKEEVENMTGLIMASMNMWAKRAYIHWGEGAGLEEGECNVESIIGLGQILGDDAKALPRLGDAPPADAVATAAVIAAELKPVFLSFSEGMYDKLMDSCTECMHSDIKHVTEEIFEWFNNLGLRGEDEVEGDLGGIMTGEAHAVLIAGPSDLVGTPGSPSRFVLFMNTVREMFPDKPLCAVLVDEDVEAFKNNLWLVTGVHQLIENADMTIFATQGELAGGLEGFFTRAKYPESSVARTSLLQLIPFPRLHFYTFATAIGGTDLEDGEIFLPAVTVGPGAGNEALPAIEKFNPSSPFIYRGFPNHERVIPGADGFAGISLIAPVKLLCSIFTGVCDNIAEKCEGGDLTWKASFGDDFTGERENMELVEAASNVQDLVSEYMQYAECGEEEEEEDLG